MKFIIYVFAVARGLLLPISIGIAMTDYKNNVFARGTKRPHNARLSSAIRMKHFS
ncbi:hypothetical protein GWK08_13935 [Leptobacterium flavescens]|uniref:Uncharacterized protein n=1 Tax=Leptobacterium flavescens TaxID=472055 RepID=A0A6P0UQ01_9FLAO|nr:hypothetical protein [Leptobacterium flavescens]NER14550.1 hypothetical protein [Leptobacterium flavescens]